MQMLAWLQQQMLNLEHQVNCFSRAPSCHICHAAIAVSS